VAVLLTTCTLRLDAQITAGTPRSETAEPNYRVQRTAGPMKLDAEFSESIWQTVDSIVDFRQREPLEGAPATDALQ